MTERRPLTAIASNALWFVGVAAFLYFLYPTPWEEHRVGERTNRLNRITGVEQISSPKGWVSPAKPDEAIEVTDLHYETRVIDGDMVDATLVGKLHNKSDQAMFDVLITISLLNEAGEVAATDYIDRHNEEIRPGDTVLYSAQSSVTASIKNPADYKIRIDSILGRPYP